MSSVLSKTDKHDLCIKSRYHFVVTGFFVSAVLKTSILSRHHNPEGRLAVYRGSKCKLLSLFNEECSALAVSPSSQTENPPYFRWVSAFYFTFFSKTISLRSIPRTTQGMCRWSRFFSINRCFRRCIRPR